MRYVIGLTGNIATGKSVVSGMLERLGARAIDADALAHELMEKGTPVWQAVVKEFGPSAALRPFGRAQGRLGSGQGSGHGQGILYSNGSINRKKLGDIVFADEAALRRLEAIVHPAVIVRTEELIGESQEPVVVVEAVKLIEAGMHRTCDALWVVTCSNEQQLARLVKQRDLTEEEARQRIEAQPPQEAKLALADVVIDNSGSLNETWRQVKSEWNKILRLKSRPGALSTLN
ncbi:MAG: dephospho-CoA kinase [Anaerolineae bacterium]